MFCFFQLQFRLTQHELLLVPVNPLNHWTLGVKHYLELSVMTVYNKDNSEASSQQQ